MSQNIDTALLRSFISAVELGGFNRAAAAVHRAESTISLQMNRLEELLGVALFQKQGRGRQLTNDGEDFLVYARQILTLHDQAISAMRPSSEVGGYVRVGAMDDYAVQVLPEVVAQFMKEHPEIDVEVTSGFSDRLVTRLGMDFDLVLSTHPVGEGAGQVLRHEDTKWAFSADLPLPDADVLPLALLPPGNIFRRWGLRALQNAGMQWRVAFTGSSITTVEAAAGAGIGVTVVKASTANSALRLLSAEDGLPPLPQTEIVLNRSSATESRQARRFGEFIETYFAGS